MSMLNIFRCICILKVLASARGEVEVGGSRLACVGEFR